jgi:hypothetical protein
MIGAHHLEIATAFGWAPEGAFFKCDEVQLPLTEQQCCFAKDCSAAHGSKS